MNRISLTLVFALLSGCGCGCAPSQASEEDTLGVVEGGPCRWHDATCVDDLDMLLCVDGEWTRESCAEHCRTIGAGVSSHGCDTDRPMGQPDALCTCAPLANGCSPGQGRCDDQATLGWCADDWTWHSSACASLCAEDSLLSLGCAPYEARATCLCTNVGTACADEAAICATDSTLARCEDGVWVEIECSEQCGWAASCNPGLEGGAGCAC